MEAHYRLGLHMLTDGSAAVLPAALQDEVTERHLERLRKRHLAWLTHENISGFGMGEKLRGRQPVADQLALRVYVVRKRPSKDLTHVVPRFVTVPGVGRLHTDVIELGRVRTQPASASAAADRNRYRPAPPGSCIGTGLRYGTFGALVRKKNTTDLYVLSNSHVIANSGLADPGAVVTQPAPDDDPRSELAALSEFVPLQYSDEGFENLADAALARVRSGRSVTAMVRLVGHAPARVNRKIVRGMLVKKVGMASDLTHSEVLDTDFKTAPLYARRGGHGALVRAGFRDQVLCHRFTEPGDSGSLVLDQSNRAVGLHFAGADNGSIFNKFGNVMRLLKIELA